MDSRLPRLRRVAIKKDHSLSHSANTNLRSFPTSGWRLWPGRHLAGAVGIHGAAADFQETKQRLHVANADGPVSTPVYSQVIPAHRGWLAPGFLFRLIMWPSRPIVIVCSVHCLQAGIARARRWELTATPNTSKKLTRRLCCGACRNRALPPTPLLSGRAQRHTQGGVRWALPALSAGIVRSERGGMREHDPTRCCPACWLNLAKLLACGAKLTTWPPLPG